MDNFKIKVQKRVMWATIYCVVFLTVAIVLMVYSDKASYPMGFTSGFISGIVALAVAFIIKYIKALKNPEALRKLYIEETDERTKEIGAKVGHTSSIITLFVLAIAMLVAVFLNKTVFYTILATVLFISVLNATLKLYYNKKL
ncbi:MAG: hypothetical protein GYA87_03360 [Christensenellaceae bacterium]|nr:hypothetical protein [Christensenellaceae bacterium]